MPASAEAMGYVLTLPEVSTVIIGCSSPAEVDENADNARRFQPFDESTMRTLEEKTRSHGAGVITSYKEAGMTNPTPQKPGRLIAAKRCRTRRSAKVADNICWSQGARAAPTVSCR